MNGWAAAKGSNYIGFGNSGLQIYWIIKLSRGGAQLYVRILLKYNKKGFLTI